MTSREEQIRTRAGNLQARGPDEYPWSYYLWLAEQQINEEAAGDDT